MVKYISRLGYRVMFVFEGVDIYVVWIGGELVHKWYSARLRYVSRAFNAGERLFVALGVSVVDRFLYRPLVSPRLYYQLRWLGGMLRADVIQAEFPAYVLSAVAASLSLRPIGVSSLSRRAPVVAVEHNVEYLWID